MSISSNYLSLTRSSNGMAGLVSGLDTDELVKALLLGQQSKMDKQDNQIKIYEYQQEAYRDVISKIDSFSNKYLSYTSSTSLISNSFFSQMTSSSTSDKFKVTAGSSAIDSDMRMKIDQLATTSTMTGGSIESVKNISGEISIASLSAANDSKVSFTLTNADDDTQTKTINLSSAEIDEILQSDTPVTKYDGITFTNKDGKLEMTVDEGWTAKVGDLGVDDSGNGTTSVGLAKLGLSAGASSGSFETKDDDNKIVTANGFSTTTDSTATAYIEVNLDGVSKKISIDDIYDPSTDTDASDVIAKLTEKLDGLFGKDNIVVNADETNPNGFTISTKEGRQITLGGSTELLGALDLSNGASNTLAAGSTVGDVFADAFKNGDVQTETNEDGEEVKYLNMTINGKDIKIYEDDTISSMVSKVNKSDAEVTMKFDSFTNTFSIEANASGAGFDMSFGGDESLMKSILGLDPTSTIELDDIVEQNAGGGYVEGEMVIGYSKGQNAVFTLNGVTTERSSNNFTINGLTFELTDTHKDGESEDIISTSRDVDSIMDGIKSFIDDYNTLIEELNGTIDEKYDKEYPPLTDEQRKEMSDSEIENWEEKAKTGILQNDDIIRDFLSEMRSAMYSPSGENGTSLWQIGIEASSDYFENGKLYIDEDKLRELLTSDPEAVQDVFAGANGLASKIAAVTKDYANTSSASAGKLVKKAGVEGTATESNNTLYQYMQECQAKLDKFKIAYDLQSNRYWAQFNRMEVVLSNLSSQSAWLSQQMAY